MARMARQRIAEGNKDKAADWMNEAIMALGMAQHPVADYTSPQHYNFQVWGGLGNPCALFAALVHHLRENKSEYDRQAAGPSDPHNPTKGDPAAYVAKQFNQNLDDILAE